MDIIIVFNLEELATLQATDRFYVSPGTRLTFNLKSEPNSVSELMKFRPEAEMIQQQRLQAFIDFERQHPFQGGGTGLYVSEYFFPGERTTQIVPIVTGIVEEKGDYKFTIGVITPNRRKFEVDPHLIVRTR